MASFLKVSMSYKSTMKMIIDYYQKGNYGKITEISHKSVVKNNLTTEHIGTYEIKKSLFGKEKIRKVKNESRTLGIEYTPQ